MKAKFKDKGFTLLELLAVIIILGIIALIATSTVGNIVEYSKKEAFKTSVKTIIKTGENYSSVAQLNSGNKLSYPVSFNCDGKACTNGDTKLEFTGKVPVSGSIVVEDAKTVKASYISDGKYCVSGTKDDLSIGKTCGDIDTTKPTITGTLTRDLLKLTMHDGESGIDSYCVSSTVGTSTCKWNEVKGNYAEHELKKNGTYSVYAKDKKGNVSEGKT
ncbi:MAG: prepilin-type N-terminal cleavage/methylation domain-containing protein, partial [Bacilli bacterium]|nr:prepilin-type N-terminal cleavage/methylation domain-containing protein [Bacilli bacterium]